MHFVDSEGADSVLPFSSTPKNYKAIIKKNTAYSLEATLTGFEIGKIAIIDIYNANDVTISGIDIIYKLDDMLAQYPISLIIGVATSTTIKIEKYANFHIESAGYLY